MIASLTTGLWHYLQGHNLLFLSEVLGGIGAGVLLIGLVAREFLVQRGSTDGRARLAALDAALVVALAVVALTIFDRFYVIR